MNKIHEGDLLNNLSLEDIMDYADSYYSQKDYAKSFRLYQKAANAGDDYAMYCIGFMYDRGQGVEKNQSKALRWFEKAANAGSRVAMIYLGDIYDNRASHSKYHGNLIDAMQDYHQAFEWYKKATDLGDVDALRMLGEMYYCGHYVKEDIHKALSYYKKAAEKGCKYSMYELAEIYRYGRKVKQNYNEALEWYSKAADEKHDDASWDIADVGLEFYRDKDYTNAFAWLSKAANYSELNAIITLGDMYFLGRGVEQDNNSAMLWYRKAMYKNSDTATCRIGDIFYQSKKYNRALEWYIDAANLGAADACYKICKIYYYGEGLTKNFNEAKEWLTKFFLQADINVDYHPNPHLNNPHFNHFLKYCYLPEYGLTEKDADKGINWLTRLAEDNPGVLCYFGDRNFIDDVNLTRALEFYLKAAEAGDAHAMCNLGDMYGRGIGVEKNYKVAFNWLKKAANLNDVIAMYGLSYLYYKGLGVKQNYDEAIEWCIKFGDVFYAL